MFRHAHPFILAALLVSPALGDDCPTAQTAKLGFVLERQGTLAEVRPASDHFVHVLNAYPGGKKQDVIYYHGFFPISRFDDTARSINIPVSDLRAVFPLEPKARRTLTYSPSQPGKVGGLISLELTVTGQEQVHLGSCTYNVLVVRNRFLNGDGKTMSEHTDLYSPELGFVLAKRYEEKGGSQTTIKYQSIKPLGRVSPL
ncbi:hypothetical protein [Microvirga lotononidis]|uniref:Uncharacterized protein n=1 Tax=Microvirga lotononidis TaxID=864069 RepID=I4YTI2_9HYPH|nr:hypothetical protein [Microvirga lotononidis]EIM27274.1 hypothetical protein MicloDRAFT_00038320 [Microvirga lotononidis]WQO28554.1 hypothetical protein U0023_05575 [Microvirga lotononidis]